MFVLEKLPFDYLKLEKVLSPESFEFHYNRHHKTYVDNLNNLIQDKPQFIDKSLEEIIICAHQNQETAIFNNAAQHWNHTFFWNSLCVQPKSVPDVILELINKSFGSLEEFYKQFCQAGIKVFGSGWVWLVLNDSKLEILQTNNANCPMLQNKVALLVCDVWEHAYYIDYRNKRAQYLEELMQYLNWDFALSNFLLYKVQ